MRIILLFAIFEIVIIVKHMDFAIIKELLEKRNMSFKELSDKLGVDRNNLYNSLMKGNPTLQRLEAVSNVLGVPVWRLFTRDVTPEVYGIIVYDGQEYTISTKQELKELTNKIIF